MGIGQASEIMESRHVEISSHRQRKLTSLNRTSHLNLTRSGNFSKSNLRNVGNIKNTLE